MANFLASCSIFGSALLLLTFVWRCRGACHLEVAQEVLVGYIELGNYDGSAPKHAPIVVNANFTVLDITRVDEVNRQVGFSIDFVQTWYEPRLRVDEINSDLNQSIADCVEGTFLPIPRELYPMLWAPPTHIPNAIDSTIAVAPVDNDEFFMDSFGNMGYWVKMEPISDLKSRAQFNQSKNISFFIDEFDDVICDDFKVTTSHAQLPSKQERFSNHIFLKRRFIYYIIQLYIPNALVVMTAWLSFFYPPDPGRISMCLGTLLALFVQYGLVATKLPKVGYLKGTDVWLLGGVVFVLLATLEYTLIAYLERKSGGMDEPIHLGKKKKSRYTVGQFAWKSDKICRYVFAVAEVLFLIFYFCWYSMAY